MPLRILSCPRPEDRTPSPVGWRCRSCDRDVVDLGRLTRRQAEPLLRRGGLCVHVRVDAQGEPIFAPEPSSRLVRTVALAGALAACSAPPARPLIHRPEVAMVPAEVPVGIGVDEIDLATLRAWENPPEQIVAPKVRPRVVHAAPAAPLPTDIYDGWMY